MYLILTIKRIWRVKEISLFWDYKKVSYFFIIVIYPHLLGLETNKKIYKITL